MGTARAEDQEAARQRSFREQYEVAGRAYHAKDYNAAIPALRAAFAIEQVPQILFNIGQAHRKLEQYGEARAYFELYRSMVKDLTPELAQQLDENIIEMRHMERERLTPQVIEKTKLLYVQQEKPLPKWLRPAGLGLGLTGIAALGAGGALLGIDGSCASAVQPPMLECAQLYNTGVAGKVLVAAGSVALVGGVVMFALSFKKPARAAVREMSALPKSEELPDMPSMQQLLLPIARPDSEPPPAGWNYDGTRTKPKE